MVSSIQRFQRAFFSGYNSNSYQKNPKALEFLASSWCHSGRRNISMKLTELLSKILRSLYQFFGKIFFPSLWRLLLLLLLRKLRKLRITWLIVHGIALQTGELFLGSARRSRLSKKNVLRIRRETILGKATLCCSALEGLSWACFIEIDLTIEESR